MSDTEVHVFEPSVDWDHRALSEYDSVIVGVAPPLSVAANGAYGALSTIGKLRDDERLVMFIDAPEPWRIFANLRAIDKNHDALFKLFYNRRRGFSEITENIRERQLVIDTALWLHSSTWPITVFPSLPWINDATLFPGVPATAGGSMIPLAVDDFLVHDNYTYTTGKNDRWVVDNDDCRWTRDTLNTVLFDGFSIREHKLRPGDVLVREMAASTGVLIGPHDDHMTWWSSTYSQAMNAKVPIITDWRLSQHIGTSWGHLAGTVEGMSDAERYELSVAQRQSFFQHAASRDETMAQLSNIIRR